MRRDRRNRHRPPTRDGDEGFDPEFLIELAGAEVVDVFFDDFVARFFEGPLIVMAWKTQDIK